MTINKDITELSREAKILMLGILQSGVITRDQAKELCALLGLDSLTVEIIDNRDKVDKDLL